MWLIKVARLRLGFESALARESLRRGDRTSCQWLIGPGSPAGPQGRGKLAAWEANPRAQRNAAGWEVLPLREISSRPEQALPKQPAPLRPASAPRPPPPAGFGSHRARGGQPQGQAPQCRSGAREAWGNSWGQRGPAAPRRLGAEDAHVTGRGVPVPMGWA